MPRGRAPTNAQLLSLLLATRADLSRETAEQRLEDLRTLLTRAPRSLRELVGRHDFLLLQRAFPASAALHALARTGLDGTAPALRRFPARVRRRLDDSGIAGSVTRHTFDHGISRWLARRFPRDAEIDWAHLRDTTALDAMLRPAVQRAEEDAFDGGERSTREWVRLTRAGRAPSDLAWVLDTVAHVHVPLRAQRAEWEAAAIPVAWTLRDAPGGVTGAESPPRAPVIRRRFRPVPADPVAHIARPLRGIRLLPRSEAARGIDLARTALAARCREVHAISYGNADEVWHADLGEGTTLLVIDVEPALRMSLEANYGYLLLANGVPVGYGGVTTLFRQANTGINVFDPFRGTEAPFLWAQVLRAFRTLFGVRRFVVNPYQVGGGNVEAIRSGAFWSYHRLGFRPADAEAARLAEAEAVRRRRDPSHRSSSDALRRLARGDLHLTLPGFRAADAFDERWLLPLAELATARIGREGAADRSRAVAAIARALARRLGAVPARWPAPERESFARLAPVVDGLPLERWSAPRRAALVSWMRAKGAPQELGFVRAGARHAALFRALGARARGAVTA